ncbi:tail fiber domain-containing protein [Candidatus Woesearchaeota archaeon]|nr:tail fiber domain-containing protein [Candidatus Woesearchaeota archaeon]
MYNKSCTMLRRILFMMLLFTIHLTNVDAERLPTVNSDDDGWGTILNNYLNVSIDDGGNLRQSIVNTTQILDATISGDDILATSEFLLANLSVTDNITSQANLTIVDSLISDYLYANTLPSILINNLSVSNDVFVAGNLSISDSLLTDFIYPGSTSNIALMGGKVLVGTTNTNGTLNVGSETDPSVVINPGTSTTVDPRLYFRDTADGAGFQILYDNDGGDTFFDNKWDNDAGDIFFRLKTDGTPIDILTLKGADKVGIGTNSPDETLSINDTYVLSVRPNGAATGELPAGVFIIPTGSNFSILSEGGGAAGESVGFYYYNGSSWYSAVEVKNVASGLSDLLLMKSGGNVGIGTSTPGDKLEVNGNISTTASAGSVVKSSSFVSNIGGQLTNFGSTDGGFYFVNNENGAISFVTAGSDRVKIDQNGNVGIGTTSPSNTLNIGGSMNISKQVIFEGLNAENSGTAVCITSNNTIIESSSATDCTLSTLKVKENISSLELGIGKVMELHPVEFDYKESYLPNAPRQAGFIAEEVANVSSLFVLYENGEPLNVEYSRLTALLTKAIQDQQKQIEELNNRIEILENAAY